MAVGALVLALLAPPTEAILNEPRAGVSLTYPTTWKLERKKRGPAVFTIPLGEGKTARAEISTATFRGTIDEWKELQSASATTAKRTVTAQEENEIAGVPLIVTNVEYVDGSDPKTAVTGLVYARTVDKLVYRIVANRADIDEAKVAFRPVIESLRTFDGKPLQPESPGSEAQVIAAQPIAALKPVKPRIISDSRNQRRQPKWESAPFPIGERKFAVFALRPAVVTANGDSVTITYAGATLNLKIGVAVDAGSAPGAMYSQANEELAQWTTVDMRQDNLMVENIVGARYDTVSRLGKKDGKSAARMLVLLDGLDVYGVGAIDFTSAEAYRRERRRYQPLLEEVGLRLLP